MEFPISADPETAPVQPNNPYGRTKAAVEQMLADVAASEASWRVACLRYFNPVGAHPEWPDRRRPAGDSQQPLSVCQPGGCRAAAAIDGFWWRLAQQMALACAITSM